MPPPAEPGIAVAIVTSSLGALVGQRRDGTPPWVFPGGGIEASGTPAAAAVREVAEETGLRVAAGPELGARLHPLTRRRIVYVACTLVSEPGDVVTASRELVEVRWLGLAELDRLMPDLFLPVRAHLGQLLPR